MAGLRKPNSVQQDAIQKVLGQSFAMIQGPPGTGKTAVVVYMSCMFASINKTLPRVCWRSGDGKSITKPQVLCCGPSNKAVDVIAG